MNTLDIPPEGPPRSMGIEDAGDLAQSVDFAFDPELCEVHDSSMYGSSLTIAMSDIEGTRFAEFKIARQTDLAKLYGSALAGLTATKEEYHGDQKPDFLRDDMGNPHMKDVDGTRDYTFHGLFGEQGKIRFSIPSLGAHVGHCNYTIFNSPEGANEMHRLLGRSPGVDVPRFVLNQSDSGINTAGNIVASIADMEIVAPRAKDSYLALHDLGAFETGAHGPSWPSSHPNFYSHVSHRAQELIEQHGEKIHDRVHRPPETVTVARALDNQIFRISPTIDRLSLDELKLRDGRLNAISNTEIAHRFIDHSFTRISPKHHYSALAEDLMIVAADAPEAEKQQFGHRTYLESILGVVEIRLALHEVQPHPEATTADTQRTLNVLRIIHQELTRGLTGDS